MKIETKLNKVLKLEDTNLKLLKLYGLALQCLPNSGTQKDIIKHIERLRDENTHKI